MNFKFENKDYDTEQLSDNGKLYINRIHNIKVKQNQLTLEFADLNVLQNHYTKLLKDELSKKISAKEASPKE